MSPCLEFTASCAWCSKCINKNISCVSYESVQVSMNVPRAILSSRAEDIHFLVLCRDARMNVGI